MTMAAGPNVWLFCPARNVWGSVPRLLREFHDLSVLLRIRGIGLKVLVIDDGSTDGTGEELGRLVQEAPYPFLVLRRNAQGLGNATNIVAGYRWALEGARPGDLVGCCDADGEHSPRAFMYHIDWLAEHPKFTGVVGSIVYPPHVGNHVDRSMMHFVGGVQAGKAAADGPFYIQSPGFQLHRVESLDAAIALLPAYRSFFEEQVGTEFPRWGMHGVILYLLAAFGARLHAAYLECFGEAPNRDADKLAAQALAGLLHHKWLSEFIDAQGRRTAR